MTGPTPSAADVGACLDDRYELLHHLARGEVGDVYEGRDRVLDRSVAVVVHRSSSPVDRATFDAEIQQLATREAPAPVRVFDAGSCGDDAYVVTELADRTTLVAALGGSWASAGADAAEAERPLDETAVGPAADATVAVPVVAQVGGPGSTEVTGRLGVLGDAGAERTQVHPVPTPLLADLPTVDAAPHRRRAAGWPVVAGVVAAVALAVVVWAAAGRDSPLDVVPATTSTSGAASGADPSDTVATTVPATAPSTTEPTAVVEVPLPGDLPIVGEPPGKGKGKVKGDDD